MLNNNNWVESYNSLNNSFDKKLLFRLGSDAGFFSEFNNMILSMIYCLINNIKFELYSESNLFAFHDAWTDFFNPFVDANHLGLNAQVNVRSYQVINSLNFAIKKNLLKFIGGADYLTQDLWQSFREDIKCYYDGGISIPKLNIKNFNLLQVSEKIINEIWVYNPQSLSIINGIKNEINLPNNYVSIHIRSGDKFLEKEIHLVDEYMNLASKQYYNSFFILTDDYTVIEKLKLRFPQFNFYTLCRDNERGYFHKEFIKKNNYEKYYSHLRLFASIDLCSDAAKFIGTFSSNPGMYMGMRIGQHKCIGVDFDKWVIW